MAKTVHIVREGGTKAKSGSTARLPLAVCWMVMCTGLNNSQVKKLLQEVNEAILFFNKQRIILNDQEDKALSLNRRTR